MVAFPNHRLQYLIVEVQRFPSHVCGVFGSDGELKGERKIAESGISLMSLLRSSAESHAQHMRRGAHQSPLAFARRRFSSIFVLGACRPFMMVQGELKAHSISKATHWVYEIVSDLPIFTLIFLTIYTRTFDLLYQSTRTQGFDRSI